MTMTKDETLNRILSHLSFLDERMGAADKARRDSSKRLDAVIARADLLDPLAPRGTPRHDIARKDFGLPALALGGLAEGGLAEGVGAAGAIGGLAASAIGGAIGAIPKAVEGANRTIAATVPESKGDSAKRTAFIDAQSKANRVAQAFGDEAAPAVRGESLAQYRRRLLSGFKQHSPQWQSVDLTSFADKALDAVETQILADAYKAALDPTNVPEGTLREVIEVDRTGRKISRFVGSIEAFLSPFKQRPKFITGFGKGI
jgi:hypothetical protein